MSDVALRCAACGTSLPARARFCLECGRPIARERAASDPALERILAAAEILEGERKLVTVLFADLKGSMELIAERDPEEARRLLAPVVEHMCEAVEQFGGTVNHVMGDGIMALFGAPAALEDHASRACQAALTMQGLVRHYGDEIQREHGVPVQIRVGLASGEVVLGVTAHGRQRTYTATGQAVHTASRMEQMAKPGSVLAAMDTVRLARGDLDVRPLGPVPVKGIEKPVEVAEIVRLAAGSARRSNAPVRATTPFLGREHELALLGDAFASLTFGRKGRVAAIVGDAGIGKSRLVHEFLRSIAGEGVLVLEGGAAPWGSGARYRPGAQILRQYFGISESDDASLVQEKVAGRILALDGDATVDGVPILGFLGALPPQHRFFGLPFEERRKRVFSALSWLAGRMTAHQRLVLAWEDIQWVTSDTLDFLKLFVQSLPASTLVLLTCRPDFDAAWMRGGETLEIRLDGLQATAVEGMIGELVGTDPSLSRLVDELPRRSGGNPLFVEEFIRSMVESGQLVGERGAYRLASDRAVIAIPASVRAVLAARIDRLSHTDKHVLQTVAAVGDSAPVAVLEKIAELPPDELRRSLRRLEGAGLLACRADGALAYELRHALTQAVAYETLLRQRRRELHRAIMEALADSGKFEVLARHAMLGEAWREAFDYLREAGRAAAQFAGLEAANYFEQALALVDHLPRSKATTEAVFDLHCELRNVLVPLGRHRQLLHVLESGRELAEELGDVRRLAQVLSFLSNYYGNVGRSALALETGERALVLGEQAQAGDLLIVGNMSVGEIYRTLGDYPKARRFLARVLELIAPANEQEHLGQVGLPAVRARSHLAWTLAELGEFVQARAVADEAIRIADVSGHPYTVCHASLGLGGMRVRQGEFEAAISVLARGLALSNEVPLLRPPIEADLGLALARTGRLAEGRAHLDAAVEAVRAIGRMSRLPLILVKSGEAQLLAGDLAGAERLATEALRLAGEQNERGNETYARRLLAEVRSARFPGSQEARDAWCDALGRAEALGMRPIVAHCHAGLAHFATDPSHRAIAASLYREMGMRYWLERLEQRNVV